MKAVVLEWDGVVAYREFPFLEENPERLEHGPELFSGMAGGGGGFRKVILVPGERG